MNFRSPLSTMVTILVGEQKAKFVIHQEFLTFHSEYFRGCLESGFIETATKVVELEHTTPEAFGLFVQWIYTKNISQKSSSDPPKSDDSILAAKDLVELWILSDYLAIPELQNKTIAMLLRAWSMRGVPIRYCINVYQSTAVGSPLRQLVVDLFAWTIRPGYFYMFKKYQNEFPHEMLFDIVEAFYKKPSLSESPVKDPSNYYVKVVTE